MPIYPAVYSSLHLTVHNEGGGGIQRLYRRRSTLQITLRRQTPSTVKGCIQLYRVICMYTKCNNYISYSYHSSSHSYYKSSHSSSNSRSKNSSHSNNKTKDQSSSEKSSWRNSWGMVMSLSSPCLATRRACVPAGWPASQTTGASSMRSKWRESDMQQVQ